MAYIEEIIGHQFNRRLGELDDNELMKITEELISDNSLDLANIVSLSGLPSLLGEDFARSSSTIRKIILSKVTTELPTLKPVAELRLELIFGRESNYFQRLPFKQITHFFTFYFRRKEYLRNRNKLMIFDK